jgi:hypothetical protein
LKKKRAGKVRRKAKKSGKPRKAVTKPKAVVKPKPRRPAIATTAIVARDSVISVAQRFKGVFRFPGEFAFLERPNQPNALLQEDDPFTGIFNETSAANTCTALKADNQDGDEADLSGKILTKNVKGQATPVLFLFG